MFHKSYIDMKQHHQQAILLHNNFNIDDEDDGKGNVLVFRLQTLNCLFSSSSSSASEKLAIFPRDRYICVCEHDRIKQIQYL